MNSHGYADFLIQIQREFDYLFVEYQFTVMECKIASSSGRYLVVIESDDCRFRFIFNRGDVDISVGTLLAPVEWDDFSQDGTRQWFALQSVLDLILEHPADLVAIRRQGLTMFYLPTTERLSLWATQLKPHCENVVKFFRLDVFEESRSALEHFSRLQADRLKQQIDEEEAKKWAK